MALNTPFLAAMLALTAATCWGSGDFVGGLATRCFGTFRSILVIFGVGMVALVTVAVIRVEQLPRLADLAWGALASGKVPRYIQRVSIRLSKQLKSRLNEDGTQDSMN